MEQSKELAHCPQTGKIYMIIIFCLLLTSMLTSVNALSKESVDDSLFGTGIAINVIQTIFTLFLLYIDLGSSCKEGIIGKKGCNESNCKWSNIAPPDVRKRTWSEGLYGYLYVFVILLSSSYLMGFGITLNYEIK